MNIAVLTIALACNAVCHDQARANLYEKLYSAAYMQTRYVPTKDEFGLTFSSKEKVPLDGAEHSLYHIEIEGPQIVKGAKSLQDVGDWLTPMLAQFADTSYEPENPVSRGVGLTVVEINGVPVAIFDYMNKTDAGSRSEAAVLFSEDRFYLVTMTSHANKKPDQASGALVMLLIDMINSGHIPGLRAPNNSFKPSPLRGLGAGAKIVPTPRPLSGPA